MNISSLLVPLRKELPIILSVGAVAGFATALYSAVKNTPKANEVLEEYNESPAETPKERIFDKAKLLLPIYGPSAGMFIISTLMVVLTNDIYRKRHTAAAVALYSANQAIERWQKVVEEKVTEKEFDEIKAEVSKPRSAPNDATVILSSEKTIMYDSFSDRYFEVINVEDVRRSVNDLNQKMRADDFVPLNDLYAEVGLKTLPFGDEIGWYIERGPIEVDLRPAFIANTNKPCVAMGYTVEPRTSYGGVNELFGR